LYALLDNKYYLDRFNEIIFAGGARLAGKILWQGGDRRLIDDMIVNGSSRVAGWFAAMIRLWQTGHIYHYAFVMILAVLGFLIYFMPIPFSK
jgi:NADH-quinone oxidoreductase subunit L